MRSSILNSADVNGSAWMVLKSHIEKRIASLRQSNDADLCESKTAMIRGGIKELKKILTDVEPKDIPTRKTKPASIGSTGDL